jgi:hemolysin III
LCVSDQICTACVVGFTPLGQVCSGFVLTHSMRKSTLIERRNNEASLLKTLPQHETCPDVRARLTHAPNTKSSEVTRQKGCVATMQFMITADSDRPQSRGEEIANSVSHGMGLLLAIASLPVLLVQFAHTAGAANIVAACVYSGSMMMLYLVSTLYHAFPVGRAKANMNRLDHAFIYIFIAGSYTPFALGALRGPWGWSLFGVIWGLAILGFTAKLFNRFKHPWLSTSLYIAMGWLVVVAAGPMMSSISPSGLWWLVVGGLFYTVGAGIFLFDHRVKFAHFVWHMFVLAGSTCHFFAVLWHSPGLLAT